VESFISLCQSPNITLRILNITHDNSQIYACLFLKEKMNRAICKLNKKIRKM